LVVKSEDALALSSDRGIAPSATPPCFAEIASFGRARAPSPIIGKGQQKVTVEHVHVHEGGQAIVGNVEGGGRRVKTENQPHALGYAPGQTLRSTNAEREALPLARDG
jgi:hypothetical protein